jgi:hypothetical protein
MHAGAGRKLRDLKKVLIKTNIMKNEKISRFYPCKDAMDWFLTQKNYKEAWKNCPRGDWMLWIAQKLGVNDRKLTLAKGKCAETVIHLMKDQRSIDAVRAAIDYGNGLINKKELNAAYAAAYAAADAAATFAAYAAAAYAAYAAAAYAAFAAYARKENQLATANICREYLTEDVFDAYKKLK